MIPITLRSTSRLVFPEGLAVLAGLAFLAWPELRARGDAFLRVYPYLIAVLGVVLGWRFRRGRLLLALAAVVIADRALAWFAAGDLATTNRGLTIAGAVALLLPLNLAALGLVRERWLPTPTGQVLLAALAGQVVAVALLVQYAAAWTAAAVRWSPLPASATAWTPLPMLGLVAALASLVVLGTRVLREPDPAGRGLFWAAVVTPVALDAGHLGQLASEGTLYLATAGLALVVAMLEASHSLAYRDELTGLLGRRAFNEALEQVGDRFTVAMVDVDHFKAFNDKHGHAVGDQILKLVGTRLAEIEGGGTPYRYGGEEFAVLFPDTPIEQALPHLERLRTAVEATTFTLRAPERPKNGEAHRRQSGSRRRQDLSVTVSIGAAASGDAGAKPQAVVQAADQALYRAKKDGRNRLIPPP